MKENIAIFTLTSELHDEVAVSAVTHEFLTSLGIEYELKGNDYSDYGSASLNLIYVRTEVRRVSFLNYCPSYKPRATGRSIC